MQQSKPICSYRLNQFRPLLFSLWGVGTLQCDARTVRTIPQEQKNATMLVLRVQDYPAQPASFHRVIPHDWWLSRLPIHA